jgi:hypothetical protein
MPRPSKFCPKTAAAILAAVNAGSTIEAACQRVHVKRTTFVTWAKRQGFSAILVEAKAAGRAANSKTVTAQALSTVQQNEPATPMRRPGSAWVPERAEVRGECTWSANDAAFACLVSIVGDVIDQLREDFRKRGISV